MSYFVFFCFSYLHVGFCGLVTFVEEERAYFHYENTPMEHTEIFYGCKNDSFRLKCFYYFHIFAQNIHCGYTLEPPH